MVFENIYENLGNVMALPKCGVQKLKCFPKVMLEKEEMVEVVLWKRSTACKFSPNQLNRATTLPWYGTGLSPKFDCVSVGYLTTI